MTKNKNISNPLLILTIVFISSCVSTWNFIIPKDLKSSIKYCYNGERTGLDSIIDIHGYYSMTFPFDRWEIKEEKYVKDTGTVNFIFYPNGLFLYQLHNYGENLSDYLKRIAYNQNKKETRDFYRYFWWGNYIVKKDTIKTYNYDPPGTSSWTGSEIWYLINADKTLSEIYTSPIGYETLEEREMYREKRRENIMKMSKAKFYYIDSLPNPDYSWIVEAKWFRCNKNQ